MTYLKSLKNLSFLIFLSGAFIANVIAQCEGVYFKTATRTIFTSPVIFLHDYNVRPVRYKDVTGDGEIDLIGTGNNINKLYISPGDGNGNFGSLIELTLSSPIHWLGEFYIEDFNNDGLNDFIVKYTATISTLEVYRNDGGGSFTRLGTTVLQTPENIENIVDINNDGRADLLTTTVQNSVLVRNYRLGNIDGSFTAQVQMADLDYKYSGDFNADGQIDFAQFIGTGFSQKLRIYFNQGNGNFSLSAELLTVGEEGTVSFLAVTDVNNDGRPDILAKNNNYAVVITNLGNGNFIKASYELNQQSASNFYTGDFNGDGFVDLLVKPDILFSSYSRSERFYSIFTNNNSGILTRRDYNAPIRGFPAGDIDGDNKTDLLTFNNYNYAVNSEPYKIFDETQISYTKNVCKRPGQTKIVDFDGDNIADKALFRPSDGRWRYATSVNHGSTIVSVSWGLNGDITQPGDYDGDGKTDIAVYRPSDGTWYIINSSNGSHTILGFGVSEDKPVSSDYDGDGTTDIAVFRPSDGNWYIYYTGTGQVSITHFGVSEDKPVPEDYDGDGKTDRAVFRPSTGVWYYLKSSDGNFAALNWGISTDVPVPADYDGDGKADIAVYRSSDNNWYILRSFNAQQYAIIRFGVAGDLPQFSDWEGNGISDLGVYRSNVNHWYSSHSNFGLTFGEAGEIPVSSILRTQ